MGELLRSDTCPVVQNISRAGVRTSASKRSYSASCDGHLISRQSVHYFPHQNIQNTYSRASMMDEGRNEPDDDIVNVEDDDIVNVEDDEHIFITLTNSLNRLLSVVIERVNTDGDEDHINVMRHEVFPDAHLSIITTIITQEMMTTLSSLGMVIVNIVAGASQLFYNVLSQIFNGCEAPEEVWEQIKLIINDKYRSR